MTGRNCEDFVKEHFIELIRSIYAVKTPILFDFFSIFR